MQESIPQDKQIALIVAFHVIVGYVVVSGMGKQMIEKIKNPVETKIIEENNPTPPSDLPPPPQLKPPPPLIPPPPQVNELYQQNYLAACTALEQYATGVLGENQLTGSAKELMEQFRDLMSSYKAQISTTGGTYADLDSINNTLTAWQQIWQARNVFNGTAPSSTSIKDVEAAAKAL